MNLDNCLTLPGFSTIGVSEKSEGKIIVLRINLSPEEYQSQSKQVKKILSLTTKERQEIEDYLNMDSKSKQIIDAFVIANNALSFNDSSEYATALRDICSKLNPTAFPQDDENAGTPRYINKNL